MKKIVLVISFLFCGYLSSDILAKTDTVQQALQAKLEKMEKTVNQLQTEVKTLRAETTKKVVPPARVRKVVIDRRGSKQVYLQ